MKLQILLLATALVAGQAHAADTSGQVTLSGKGEGRWEAVCDIVVGGESKTTILGPDHASYSGARLTHAECRYRASDKSDLVLSLTGAQTCPFAGATPEACTLVVAPGKAGFLNFQEKKAR